MARPTAVPTATSVASSPARPAHARHSSRPGRVMPSSEYAANAAISAGVTPYWWTTTTLATASTAPGSQPTTRRIAGTGTSSGSSGLVVFGTSAVSITVRPFAAPV